MITRGIYPLSLRQRVSYHIARYFPDLQEKDVDLEFCKSLRFDLLRSDVGHRSIIFNGFYELKLTKTILRLALGGGTMVDVGANYGYFSCIWAWQQPKNQVLAFEASPANIAPLTHNVIKNRLGDRITILPYALGREKTSMMFSLENEEQQTGWGGLTITADEKSVEVAVDTLDNVANEYDLQQIEVLKIDTEGADTWVLEGASRLLSEKRIHHIFFEENTVRIAKLNIDKFQAKSLLKKYGYMVEQFCPNEYYAYPRPG
ncbi:FkbM family methyltransferase [Neolewinella litorea]|uniref:FkbM family methyltransferase n=1 Tax=Neolewinella litorea TaxID=2562452 RepID=A0A4S4NNS2_9BACT|nr:FkbM family methyltransferase [Neolewinella litorea]THH40031.1 FkbM family methyltransferase [Neolewinella litorea]